MLIRRAWNKMKYLYNEKVNYQKLLRHTVNGSFSTNYYGAEYVICSLTTLPQRIDVVHLSIMSILKQTTRPHKVILYLGSELFKNIKLPDNLMKLQNNGLEIKYVKDVMVHTKYFYAFQEYPNSIVITFDDDILYQKTLIEELLKLHEKYKNSVVCSRAHKMKFNCGQLEPYNEWDWNAKTSFPSMYFFATGVGGVLYPTKCFDNRTFKVNDFFELSSKNDDIWLKCMEVLIKLPVVTLNEKTWFLEIKNSQNTSLNSLNVHASQNDIYLDNVFQKYKITEKSFEI